MLEFPDRAAVDEYLKSLDFQLLSRCERKIVQPPLLLGHKDGGGDHFYGNDGSVLITEWLYNHSGEEGSAEEDSEGEISLDEAEAVAGGGECYCVAGGGGTGGDDDSFCACVVFGEGMPNNVITDRCECFMYGQGETWNQ